MTPTTALLGAGSILHVVGGRYIDTDTRFAGADGKSWHAICGARGKLLGFDRDRAARACPRCRAKLEEAVAEAFGQLNDADEDVTTDTA